MVCLSGCKTKINLIRCQSSKALHLLASILLPLPDGVPLPVQHVHVQVPDPKSPDCGVTQDYEPPPPPQVHPGLQMLMLLELWLVSDITQVQLGVAAVKLTEVLCLVNIQSELYAALHIKTLL